MSHFNLRRIALGLLFVLTILYVIKTHRQCMADPNACALDLRDYDGAITPGRNR